MAIPRFKKPFQVVLSKRDGNKVKIVRQNICDLEDFETVCRKAKSENYGVVNGMTPERQLLLALATHCGFIE